MAKKKVDEFGPEMKNFKCTNCGDTYPDWQKYFYDTAGKRCIACMKNPKRLQKQRTFK